MAQAVQEKEVVAALRKVPHPEVVAGEFGISTSTVYRIVKRNDIDLEALRAVEGFDSADKETLIRSLLLWGVNRSEIARRLGVSLSYISQVAW